MCKNIMILARLRFELCTPDFKSRLIIDNRQERSTWRETKRSTKRKQKDFGVVHKCRHGLRERVTILMKTELM